VGSSVNAEFVGSEMHTRNSPTDLEYPAGRLFVTDVYGSHVLTSHRAARANLGFRTVDEVKEAIRLLRELLPLVDRLGAVVEGEPDGE
jgi:hypothetical protein